MAVTGQTTAGMACSFCLMSDVAAMIAGPGVFICDSCVAAFAEILSGNKPTGLTTMADVQQNLRDDDDLLALLPKVAAAGAQPERQLALLVGKARARGITWAKIGAAMGHDPPGRVAALLGRAIGLICATGRICTRES